MTIAVFLDTNIIMSDYKMAGTSFEELFKVHEELSSGENFKLILTEMNYHEILMNYKSQLNKTFKSFSIFKSELLRLTEIKNEISSKEMKSKIIEDYENKLNDTFFIEYGSNEAAHNVFNRFFSKKMPFRDNKSEFKDALIWETIYEYGVRNPEEKIYFVSQNFKDFAFESKDGKFKLHEHFDNLNDRIKYLKGLKEFLVEIDHLKVHHFDFNEENEILEIIESELMETYIYSPIFEAGLYDFFSNHNFHSDYFEGWGSDYSIQKIVGLEIPDRSLVLETDEFFYIPIYFIADMEFFVEITNPVYEQFTGDPEFIQSESIEDQFGFECTIKFDPKQKTILGIEDINIFFL